MAVIASVDREGHHRILLHPPGRRRSIGRSFQPGLVCLGKGAELVWDPRRDPGGGDATDAPTPAPADLHGRPDDDASTRVSQHLVPVPVLRTLPATDEGRTGWTGKGSTGSFMGNGSSRRCASRRGRAARPRTGAHWSWPSTDVPAAELSWGRFGRPPSRRRRSRRRRG